jgi:hypothetical protein
MAGYLINHAFLEARLKQSWRLLGDNRMAEIRALPFAAPVALKEFELRSSFHSDGNDWLLQTLANTDRSADKGWTQAQLYFWRFYRIEGMPEFMDAGVYLGRVFSLSSARFNSSSFCPASPSLPSAVRR